MSLGIYKQGQGYWVRVLTAAGLGLLIIAAAAWGWSQAGIVRLPAREWSLSLSNVQGDLQPGESVVLQYYNVESNTPEEITEMGSAVIESFDAGKSASGVLIISNFDSEIVQKRASDAVNIYVGTPSDKSTTAIVRGGTPTPIFPVLYLQAGVAGGIMIIGALATYIIAGIKKSSVEFLIATDGEMKKVNWTTYKEVKGSTIVVIVATFLIAGFLFGVDSIFARFFTWIDVLQK
jgi:preprotein translocase SecE subunit